MEKVTPGRQENALQLELLEDRIFLDANPLAAAAGLDAAAHGLDGHLDHSAQVHLPDHTTVTDVQAASAAHAGAAQGLQEAASPPAQPATGTAATPDSHPASPAKVSDRGVPADAGRIAADSGGNSGGAQAGTQNVTVHSAAPSENALHDADGPAVPAAAADPTAAPAGPASTHAANAQATATTGNSGTHAAAADLAVHHDPPAQVPAAHTVSANGSPADSAAQAPIEGHTDALAAAPDNHDPTAPDGHSTETVEQHADGAETADHATLGLSHAADADAAVDPMIGEDFTFTVTFDNTTGSTIYGPYIDMLLDGGQDGADAAVDGITFDHATYLGADVESTVINITTDGQIIEHPWATDNSGAPLELSGISGQTFHAGDQFVSLRMPFGSFTTDQPSADVVVTAHMSENADVGVDLGVHTTTGAMFGHDALDNPTGDHPLRDIATHQTTYKPEVVTYNADIQVPQVAGDCQQQHDPAHDDTRQWADDAGRTFEVNHQEIPTGPNFPASYVARIDIADGQTVDGGLTLTEHLPDNIYYLGDATVSVTAGGVALTQGTDYSVTSPGSGVHSGQDLVVSLNNTVTGGAGHGDVVVRYDFYVPDQTAAGSPVIDPATGDVAHVVNNGEVDYGWNPHDPHDSHVADTINAEVNADGHFSSNPDVDDISHAQSIAIQKAHTLQDTGAAGPTPGDTLDYSLDFQVSDYFSFGDHDLTDSDYSFRIDDVVADGLAMHTDAGGHFTATIDIWENGNHYHRTLADSGTAGDGMWTTLSAGHDLEVHYNLQQILSGMGVTGGRLNGDLVDGHPDGPTHGRITYQADIAQAYHSETGGGGDNDVDQGDIIDSGVAITGEVYDPGTSAFTGHSEADASCDVIQIVTGSVEKDIYAINGATGVGPNPHISPGDTVTYHLHYDMPISSTEDFHLNDYLPLPIFDVHDPDQDGTASGWSKASDGTLPGAGQWAYTAGDTYHTLSGVQLDAVSAQSGNALVFDWAPYHDGSDTHSSVDILFTVTASNKPFADGLFLTNQVRATEQGTPLADNHTDAIVQIVLDEPDLHITKGVVATDNPDGQFSPTDVGPVTFSAPGSSGFRGGGDITESGLALHPVDADLSHIDAGDLVTFAIVAQNVGHSGAFDVKITDDLPAGFAVPGSGLNLSVTDGHGSAVSYTDASGDAPGSAGFDFFSGIVLADDADGALNANHDGLDQTDNIVVITYDLQAADGVQPAQHITNTAAVADVAGTEGGPDHYPSDADGPHDTATVTMARPAVAKTIVGTGETSTAGNDVVIGETVQYQVQITVPEGQSHNVHLADTLDPGLAIVSIDAIEHGDLQTDHAGGWNQVLTDAQNGLASPGHDFSIDFGNLTNPDRDSDHADETITVTYTAVVLNTSGNQQGTQLNNAAAWQWDNPGGVQLHENAHAPDVTVQEPDLQVDKEVWDPATSAWVDADDTAHAVHYDQADAVQYRITVQHSAASHEDAFDAVFSDTLPAAVDWSSASVSVVSGDAPTSQSFASGVLSATWDKLDLGHATTFLVTGGVLNTATAGQVITNTGTVTWESLDAEHHADNTQISPYNADSGERTGDTGGIGGAANNYTHSNPGVISVSGAIDKLDPARAQYTIGDHVTYDIVVTLSEGGTHGLTVSDDLPDGMAYLGSSVDATGFSGPTDVTHPTVTTNAGDVFFDFGDVSVTANNNATDNSFVIHVETVVEDVAGNHGDDPGTAAFDPTTLTNHAAMHFDDPAHPGTSVTVHDPTDPTITVIEPQITTTKSVVDSADAGTDASPGEILTYTARFTNTGDATAYNVTADDILAPGTSFDHLIHAAFNNGHSSTDITGTTMITDHHDGTISFDSTAPGTWRIPENGYIEVQYAVQVMGAGFAAGSHTNTVDADWSSQFGTLNPVNRTYDDGHTGPGSPVDGTQDTASAAFAVVADGSIGDTVFFDAGGDGGTFNAAGGDVGISGVDVTITADVDGDGTPEFSQTVRTDAAGHYTFNNLAAFGDYVITVDPNTSGGTQPTDLTAAGFSPTYDLDGAATTPHSASHVALAAGQQRTDVDFGYTGQNTVGDTVWVDADADGVQDSGEGGIGNLTVTLTADIDGDGVAEYTATTTTDAAGHYQFDHLPAGDYNVRVTPPAGSEATYDQDSHTASPDNATPFTLAAHQDRDDIDFGIRGTGAIGDFVWFDGNADAVQNDGAHAGLAGVTVTLSGDIDGDGHPDYTTTTVTANDGAYHFDHLLGGDYTVTVEDTTLPAGAANWHPTFDADGTATAHTAAVALAAGATDNSVDFGYTGTGAIGDFIFFDSNHNGVQDAGEVGIANVQVTVSGDVDGDGIAEFTTTVTTDNDGNYHVDHLPAGAYTVSVAAASLPSGFSPSADPDGVLDNHSTLNLGVGEVNNSMDFGYASVGAIGDFIFFDADADGHQDSGEAGIGGVTVTLVGDIDNDGIDETLTTVTDAHGHYLFDNLPDGSYTVTVDHTTLPGGMQPSADPDGVPDHTTAVTLSAGETNLDQDFGYTGSGVIGDTIWNDANRNGVMDGGESGLAGVQVTLGVDLNGDGTPDYHATTVTGPDGTYRFEHLPAGRHTVSVDPATLPPGMRATFDPDGVLDGTITLQLAAGQTRLDADFGYALPPQPPAQVPAPSGGHGTPAPSVVPGQPAGPQFAFDVLFERQEAHAVETSLDRYFERLDEQPWLRPARARVFEPPLIPVSPIYSGYAEPGTTLRLDLYDALGDRIGYETVMADAAGNWLSTFAGTLIFDEPHHLHIEQVPSTYNASTAGGFNLRTYFSPATESKLFSSTDLSAHAVFATTPSAVLDAMQGVNHHPLNLGWDDFYDYEFFVPSTNPAQSSL